MKSKADQMSEALDIIHDIALKVDKSDKQAVRKVLNAIGSVARHKFNVLGNEVKELTK